MRQPNLRPIVIEYEEPIPEGYRIVETCNGLYLMRKLTDIEKHIIDTNPELIAEDVFWYGELNQGYKPSKLD